MNDNIANSHYNRRRSTKNQEEDIKCPKFCKMMGILTENSRNNSIEIPDSSNRNNLKITNDKIKSLIFHEKQKLNLKRIQNIKVEIRRNLRFLNLQTKSRKMT